MTDADRISLDRHHAFIRARLHGIDPTGMSPAEIHEAVAVVAADRKQHPGWLIGRRGGPGGTVEETAAAMVAAAQTVPVASPLGVALYDILSAATSHRPEFSTRTDGTPAEEPWGCAACGCADGVGACGTWTNGVALTRALAVEGLRPEFGRQIVDDSCGNGHMVGHVSSLYRTRQDAIAGGNGLGLFTDQIIVRRHVTPWTPNQDDS